jgi:chemotaxis protein MotB
MAARKRARSSPNLWPGFVDALAGLLLAFIFLLVVFVLYQFFLRDLLSDQDVALERLNREIAELGELLALERRASADLRLDMAQLSASLQSSTAERDELVLALRVQAGRADDAEAALAAARQTVEIERETVAAQLSELEILRRDIEALRVVRAELEAEVGRMAAAMSESETVATALRDRARELEARLASEEERTALAQQELKKREIRLAEVLALRLRAERDLDAEREVSSHAKARLDILNQQILALRDQLARIETALEATEAKDREQNVVIADLGRRLNLALAQKVEELERYRSEFFGRLREVVGERTDIAIVGDRFVFQSEVLFSSGSANLGDEGAGQLATFATTLLEIAGKIPDELPWILRVDGHTDRIPINTAAFPSNWELSSARANSVVKFLVSQGVSPTRLASTGFAEHQPIDPGDSVEAYRRNRRIELKLTER